MNRRKLKGEIVAKYGTQDAFANAIGWHRNKVSKIITGKYSPNTDEVADIVQILGISENTFIEIFLHQISPNGDSYPEKPANA